ncbi:MAG: hypothetical protein AAGK02_10320 [Pseudomonadota bacterium]
MTATNPNLEMPKARAFGWALRPASASHFAIHQRANGQFCVVLNHALLRGVTAEMLHWWFLHFPLLKVRLRDVPGYDGTVVPAYALWHPSDHHSAQLRGTLGPGGTSKVGAKIHIREAMQYERYGWKYPVDTELGIFYVDGDGWAMGRKVPLLGPVMVLRIHFRDIYDGAQHVGVHYHYEVVIGLSGEHVLARWINAKLSAKFGPEFFSAWHLHNVIEVGTFENFLAPLFAQRNRGEELTYSPNMDPVAGSEATSEGFDQAFFDARVAAAKTTSDPYAWQAHAQPSIL